MHARIIALTALAGFALGCEDDFEPRTLLDGYRVIGVEADKPEPTPEDTVLLTVHDVDTDGGAPTYAWTLCLYSLGTAFDFACADPALQIDLGSDRAVTVDLGPGGVDFRAQFEAAGDIYDAEGELVTLEGGHVVYAVVESGVTGGRQIRTAKRLIVRDTDEARNANPSIEALESTGAARPGETVRLAVTVADTARQTYVDGDGESVQEELLFTWYTTAGELDPGLTYGDDLDTELELPNTPGTLDVWVAVRDGRGGLAIAHRPIEVVP